MTTTSNNDTKTSALIVTEEGSLLRCQAAHLILLPGEYPSLFQESIQHIMGTASVIDFSKFLRLAQAGG